MILLIPLTLSNLISSHPGNSIRPFLSGEKKSSSHRRHEEKRRSEIICIFIIYLLIYANVSLDVDDTITTANHHTARTSP